MKYEQREKINSQLQNFSNNYNHTVKLLLLKKVFFLCFQENKKLRAKEKEEKIRKRENERMSERETGKKRRYFLERQNWEEEIEQIPRKRKSRGRSR